MNWKICLIFLSFLFLNSQIIFSQTPELWGMTQEGGVNGKGTIFRINGDGSNYSLEFFFDSASGYSPTGSLLVNSGKLYGLTQLGGVGLGTIFSFDPFSHVYDVLFDLVNFGCQPLGSLTKASNGKLYAMPNGCDDIISYDTLNNSCVEVHSFVGPDFQRPWSNNLLQSSNGFMYGMTRDGGTFGNPPFSDGILFQFDPSNNNFLKVFDFDSVHGRWPYGSLIEATDGFLYGMNIMGGANDGGVLFKFDPSNNSLFTIYDFDSAEGDGPTGSLIQSMNGDLYGMTSHGGVYDGGTIFKYDLTNNIYTKLVDFDSTNGRYPFGSLIEASDGKLYGMTVFGGLSDSGVVFSYDPSDSLFTKIHDFARPSGNLPWGDLVEFNSLLIGIKNYPEPSIKLSPNPTAGKFILEDNFDNINQINIFNTLGENMKDIMVDCRLKTVDCTLLPSGIYFLKATAGEKIFFGKFIKQ